MASSSPRDVHNLDSALPATQLLMATYILRKHHRKILAISLLALFAAAAWSLLATPFYRADSRLLVRVGREDVYVSPTPTKAVVDRGPREGYKLNSEMAILQSPRLVIELVDQFGIDRLFEYKNGENARQLPLEKVYEVVGNNLHVSSLPKSNVIGIAFEWPDPAIAAQMVNKLVDLYMIHHVKVHTDTGTLSLLSNNMREWEEKLRESENALEAFRRANDVTSLPEQKSLLLKSIFDIESKKNQLDGEIAETTQMAKALKRQLFELDQNVQLQETINTQSTTLTALKTKLVDLEMQGLREEINRVKEMIAEEESKDNVILVSGRSPIHQKLEGDLLAAQSKLGAMQSKRRSHRNQAKAYRDKLDNLLESEKQMKELERNVEIDEANYKLYLGSFEEARISANMDANNIANVSIIERAIPPRKPVKPKKVRNVLLGGILGLWAAIGIVFFLEFINPVFRMREDVDHFLGLPVLVVLPNGHMSRSPATS